MMTKTNLIGLLFFNEGDIKEIYQETPEMLVDFCKAYIMKTTDENGGEIVSAM